MFAEGTQLGQYRLRRLIGRGGTGEVYLAEDQRIKRQVAIKIVETEDPNSSGSARTAIRLFQREAQAIAVLNHPNILPLFDFGEEIIDGITIAYLVTPFCPEGSLAAWLRHRGTPILLPHQVLYIIQQAADALEYAHDQQLVHRDVKPSNFLVRSRKDAPDRPNLLLADFGIARLTQGTINASRTIRGTPKYMAPEQWTGNALPATDQYALAVMTYELLVGRPPITGTQEEVMYNHLMVEPPPPSAFNPRITPGIDAVLLRALAKQPEARFPSITGFADAFQQTVQVVSEPAITPVIMLPPSSPFTPLPPSSPDIRGTLNPPLPFPTHPIVKDISQGVSKGQRQESLPFPTPPSVKDTPNISISGIEQSGDFHTALTISTTEAALGVNRTITLPDRQRVKVAVPAGAYDGQVIRLERQIEATAPNIPKGDLIVRITVTPKAESAVVEAIPGLPSIHWRTYLLFGLALIVLLSSIIGLSHLGIGLIPTNRTNATNNNTSSHTLQATSSAATASAIAQATATAQANATAAVTANLYDSSLKTLALNESLSKNSNSRWDETGGRCAFTAGSYHVINLAQATATHVCVARGTNFSDFAFEVQMNILKGDGGGILLRSTSSSSYYFRISQNGNYALLACAAEGTSCNRILISDFSSWINSGQNLIAVVATRNSIDLYANGVRINGVKDSSSLQGQIGVVAEASSEVVFSNVRVWTP